MKKILVISDTHRNASNLEKVMKIEKQVDVVFHLGDIEGASTYIKQVTQAPLYAVRGNCDFGSPLPAERIETIEGHTFFLTHGHKYDVDYDLRELTEVAKACGAEAALFGHTHVPCYQKTEDGLYLLNPGSLSRPRQSPPKAAYMVIEAEEGRPLQIHPEHLEI